MRKSLLSVLAGLCVLTLSLPPAWGADEFDDLFTLPRLAVNVGVQNGWVVAHARTLDQAQRVIWSVPLAPAGPNVSVTQGLQAVLVEVGGRQFLIDKATGRTRELRPGQVYREPALGGPTGRPAGPASPGRQAVDALSEANQVLEAALADLEEAQRLARSGRLRDQDVQAMAQRVEQALQQVAQAQQEALRRLAPPEPRRAAPVAPATQPARPERPPTPAEPISQAVRKAQARVMELAALHSRTQQDLRVAEEEYQAGRTGPELVEALRGRLGQLATGLDEADAELRRARMIGRDVAMEFLTPQTQARLARGQREVLSALETHEAAEAHLLRTQEALERGEASQADLALAQVRLLETFKTLTAARKDLADAHRLAEALVRHQRERAATRPAGE